MDLLWPNSRKTSASNSLRQALHAARRTLAPEAEQGRRLLRSEGEMLTLCPRSDLWVDVDAFEEAASNARRVQDLAAFRAAVDLYAGELLPDDRYEPWAEDRRGALRRLHLALLAELGSLYEDRGEYRYAVETFRKLVDDEPVNEEGNVGLMRLHFAAGRRAEALTQYERLREALARELGTEPGASARRLYEEISAARPPGPAGTARHARRPSAGAGHGNLPAPKSALVGREREMREVKRDLAMTRLLTLTGVGGSGKTRLALEVARELVACYHHGVWLAELASISKDHLVPSAVASVFQVRERPGRPLTEVLVETLRHKQALLVLDNCEHLLEGVGPLTDALLSGCPDLRVLATSRERLGVQGEVSRPVPPLSVPGPDGPLSVAELEIYEAARMFLGHARRHRPDFALTAQNVRAVAEVCRRLEGVPLALELAAARVAALSVQQIADKLGRCLPFLVGGCRTLPVRQQTMRGALDWSHDLLNRAERVVFRRLSVFVGGWTMEEAEAVASGGEIGKGDVLEFLSELVQKSLVVATIVESGASRYRMLEPIRQYASEKLERSGEGPTVRRRHAELFLALAERAEPHLREPDQQSWLERLDAEYDNIRAALSWGLESGQTEMGLRLSGALEPYWDGRGMYEEGRRWLEESLAGDGPPSPMRAKALEKLGWLAFDQGDLDRAAEAAQEGINLGRRGVEVGSSRTARFRDILGNVARIRGNLEVAESLFKGSLALYRAAGDASGVARSLLQLGDVAVDRGDHERSIALHEEGLGLCRREGYAAMLPLYLVSLGREFLLRGHTEQASKLNEEALALHRERGRGGNLVSGFGQHAQTALNNLGWVSLVRGDYARATALYTDSLRLSKRLGDKLIAAESLEGLACGAGAAGAAERSARLFGMAWALQESAGYAHTRAETALREPFLAAARARLDAAAWEAAVSEGMGMSLEEGIGYALSSPGKADTISSAVPTREAMAASPALTSREEEVAMLVAQGLTNRQVACRLFISEHTAATHVARALKKLGLRSRSQLAAWAARQGPGRGPE